MIFCAYSPADNNSYTEIDRLPAISPDYCQITIPANIGPLNFNIEESGSSFLVRIYTNNDSAITIESRESKIMIPAGKWKQLLSDNKGGQLFIEISSKDSTGKWNRYKTITNNIAGEEIDSYIAYRLMSPSSYFPKKMGIYQRNLETLKESEILHTSSYGNGCVNCHTFNANNPDSMLMGVRSTNYGSATIYAKDGQVSKIGAKFGYTSWHPSGKLAVYSINNVKQFYHTSGTEIHGVVDLDSAMSYYLVDSQKVKTTDTMSDTEKLETYPTWSPDGKYLYFCSASFAWEDRTKTPPDNYEKSKYDLVRVSYDIENDEWGDIETVLSSAQTGLSILLPRFSPDGRYLLFCMTKYGCFPIYQPSSDLYMMDMETGKYEKLAINSEYTEAWHSWSSNGKWIAFSTKRDDGIFTRTYISYIDENGKARKPFVMPQKDPLYYSALPKVYSVPEFITGPVNIKQKKIARTVRSKDKIQVDLPITGATSKKPPQYETSRE